MAIHRADEISHLIAAFNSLIISVVQRVQAMRQSEGRYRALPDGSTLRVNAAWERLWNIPGATMTGYNVLQDASAGSHWHSGLAAPRFCR